MSLADLSRLAGGVSAEEISYLERGKRNGRHGTLEKIAHALGVTISDLFAEPGNKTKRRRRVA